MRLVVLPQHKPASEKSLSIDAKKKENEVQFKYLQGFLRFLETVNRIRRPPVTSLKVGVGGVHPPYFFEIMSIFVRSHTSTG